jgi:hypothetical protein
VYGACRDLTLELVAAIVTMSDDGHMTNKAGISAARSLLLRGSFLTVACSAAALAVAPSQAMAAPPSQERPVAGRAAPLALSCPPACGDLVTALRGWGLPVVPGVVPVRWGDLDVRLIGREELPISSSDLLIKGPRGPQGF